MILDFSRARSGAMPDAITLKLTQTTACVGLLMAGGLFGGGYFAGDHAARSDCQAQIDQVNQQMMYTMQKVMDLNMYRMRSFHESRQKEQPTACDSSAAPYDSQGSAAREESSLPRPERNEAL
jgi:hypothetical protein